MLPEAHEIQTFTEIVRPKCTAGDVNLLRTASVERRALRLVLEAAWPENAFEAPVLQPIEAA